MIVINARFLTQPTTGVQRFAEQVTSALGEIRNDLLLVGPAGTRLPDHLSHLRLTTVGRLSGHLWEQIDLPRFLRRNQDPTLLNLSSTGPVSYRPQVSTHHDITYVRHPDSFSRSFRMAYALIVPRLIRSSVELITVSEFSRNEISSHLGVPASAFTVVPNAVDPRFRPGASGTTSFGGRPFFLAVSSPNAHKNFDRMMLAFDEFSRSMPGIDLLVIGSQARSFTKQNQLKARSENVRFLGRVSDDELIALYRQALAFVFPSLYEGFGIPPLEAQACGCPVLASTAASMPEVLGKSALYFDPYDPNQIAAAMARVATDALLRSELIVAGTANVARYSWNDSARTVSNLLDSVTRSSSTRIDSPSSEDEHAW